MFVLMSFERMWHLNKTHLSLALLAISAFVVYVGLDSPLFALINQRVQKGHRELTFSSFKDGGRQKPLNIVNRLQVERAIQGDRKLEKVEASLAKARSLIKEALLRTKATVPQEDTHDYIPQGDIYRNAAAFHRSYTIMEKVFRIFVYEEGEPPLFHYGPCKNIYSMEGIFINLLEINTLFRTQNPDEAHVYFLPFSVVMILEHLFHPVIRDKAVLGRTIGDYVRIISHKYKYWNRSYGADHFMLSCHDWGPRSTWYVKELYFIAIRVLCNANISEHFNPKKDASFPEINLVTGDTTDLIGGYPTRNRTILAFFAGQMHGRIRPVLFQHWESKDKDVLVYQKLPDGVSYHETMKKSRYCICPSGFEVASPRIVEAIYAQCVPVIISQQYVLPFSDVLNWDSFSVQILVSDIPKLKEILLGISEEKYLRLQEGVRQVQRHFVVNNPPKRYDVFHMIIHSIWLRRLNVRVK
ncbi:probable glycosyltransferase At3g07620 [Cajanus cajan]|uniref:Multiple exostoses isogeny 1 n=1 Tax=Cajanus cajan TaxID=3821 RepID=A0A151SZI3_CAJCA|nr:probable glycosyltransferase At3g07620 [Cajanus cajan]KYP60220.1 Multiple exostoses isogeny 1 [Cajanus cajan]